MKRMALSLLSFLVACGQSTSDWVRLKQEIRDRYPDVQQLSVEHFAQSRPNEETLIIDVREPEEYAVSHLQGAMNLRDPDAIEAAISASGAKKVVLYCSVGYRSSAIVAELQKRGHAGVANLEGSLFEWANQGRPVYRSAAVTTGVHPYDEKWGQLLDESLWSWSATESGAESE